MKSRGLVFLCLLMTFSAALGQKKSTELSISFENQKLATILDSLSDRTTYFFSYNAALLNSADLFTIKADHLSLDDLLRKLLIGTGLSYSFYKDQVIITKERQNSRKTKNKTFSISGKITNNNIDLADVNIFLSGTTIGTFTNENGEFRISNIPAGTYQVVLSKIGFEAANFQIGEFEGINRVLIHEMTEHIQELQPVEVIGKPISRTAADWKRSFEVFSSELLGENAVEMGCYIKNPEVLRFYLHNGKLRATAKTPLEIRNEWLGYEITYILESFEKDSSDLRFRGDLQFKRLVPNNRKQWKKWKQNRLSSFEGSFNHFKRSLLNNSIDEDGFQLYKIKNLQQPKFVVANIVRPEEILTFKDTHYELSFKDYLAVLYMKGEALDLRLLEAGLVNFKDQLVVEGDYLAALTLFKNKVKFSLSGQAIDRFAMGSYGYFSEERLSAIVPVDFNEKRNRKWSKR